MRPSLQLSMMLSERLHSGNGKRRLGTLGRISELPPANGRARKPCKTMESAETPDPVCGLARYLLLCWNVPLFYLRSR